MPRIETMTPAEASVYLKQFGLKFSPQFIRYGIQQGAFPWGDHVEIGQHEYAIYKRLLDEWVARRAVIEEDKP